MTYSPWKRRISIAGALAAGITGAVLLASCGSSGQTSATGGASSPSNSSSPTSQANGTTPAPTAAQNTSAASGDTAPSSEASGPAAITVPAGSLIKPDTLTFCSDISSPPLEFYKDNSNVPTGSDVDLGNAMAAKMGLTAQWANTNFNGIIPALQAKRCDVIMSQLYIKPEREKVVDFVPYMYSGSTFIVKQTGGLDMTSPTDLCGKKAAGETGTTVIDYLQQQSTECEKDGKSAIDIRQFTTDPSALQQLKLGLVDAYGTTVETAAYDMQQNPNQFAMAGKPFNRIKVGAATNKDNTPLHDALAQALAQIQADGQYDSILKTWGLTADSITSQ